MNIRLLSVAAALVLSVAAPATAAFAQDAGTLNVWGARIDAPQASRSFFGMPAWVLGNQEAAASRDGLTTGSIAPRRAYRGVNSADNGRIPAQRDRFVPQDDTSLDDSAE